MSVSTHVLDPVLGRPATRMTVQLSAGEELVAEGSPTPTVGAGWPRGRPSRAPTGWSSPPVRGSQAGRDTFHPVVVLSFDIREPAEHHHVPLLLAPFAYSTHRGSQRQDPVLPTLAGAERAPGRGRLHHDLRQRGRRLPRCSTCNSAAHGDPARPDQ